MLNNKALLLCVLMSSSCDGTRTNAQNGRHYVDGPGASAPRTAISYDYELRETLGTGYVSPLTSLCQLVGLNSPIAHVRVERLGTRMEAFNGSEVPYTYITLRVLDRVRGIGRDPELVVRMAGGLRADGAMVSSPIKTQLGEEFVAFFDPRTDVNQGYLGIVHLGMFRVDGEGFATNGRLFSVNRLTARGLSALIRTRLARCDSYNDVRPDVSLPRQRRELSEVSLQAPERVVLSTDAD